MNDRANHRKAELKDLDKIVEVGRTSFTETEGSVFGKTQLEKYLNREFDKKTIQIELTENTKYYIVESETKIVGFSKVKINIQKHEAELCKIYLLKEFKGTGIGSSLLNKVEYDLRLLNIQNLFLSVWADNANAIKFYVSKGFEKYDEEPFFIAKELNEPEINGKNDLMRKTLSVQSTSNILMIRPSNFVFNSETEASNAFQIKVSESEDVIKQKAFAEFEAFASTLKSKGVNVFVFDDTQFPEKPDAIFPNNWVTFHSDGTVILYPMFAHNRRYERRQGIIDSLKKNFRVTNVVDLSKYEKKNRFLEGTGSIVFDHDNKIAYACLSPRTDKELFIRVCDYLHYKSVYFHSHDKDGKEIYHTNVMMCIGEKFAVICLDTITDKQERENVSHSLTDTGHQVIDITIEQMNHFAGNMLAIQTNDNKNILVLSQSSFDSLTTNQRQEIEKFCELVPLSIKTIETIGGGSARCMIAEVFLPQLGDHLI